MRQLCTALALTALVGQSGLVVADDTNSDRPIESYKQMMKDCMRREQASNPTASSEERTRVCREKIKSYDDHPSENTAPPQNPG
jgi:muramidase (phage lysozyme)